MADALLFFVCIKPKETRQINNYAGERILLFVGQKLDPRIPRLGKWINKSKEYATIILCHKDYYVKEYASKNQGLVLFYRNEWHLRRIVSSAKVYLIHGYAPLSKFPAIALEAAKKYNKDIPFIMDYQDVYVTYFGKNPGDRIAWLKDDLKYEEYCFNNADGLIADSMEPYVADKLWNKKKISSRLFFPLYADDESFAGNNAKIATDETHLVYVGGLVRQGVDAYFGGIAQLHWLIDMLLPQKIHLHVYPSLNVTKLDIEDYKRIATENKYFHIHDSVTQENLSEELSQYHYGLIPFFRGTSDYDDAKFKNAATLKIFNYLEAGIPVLTSRDYEFQGWLTERYKLGFVFDKKEDFKNLSDKIAVTPYALQVANLIKGRERLSLKAQYPRVLKFYDSFNKG